MNTPLRGRKRLASPLVLLSLPLLLLALAAPPDTASAQGDANLDASLSITIGKDESLPTRIRCHRLEGDEGPSLLLIHGANHSGTAFDPWFWEMARGQGSYAGLQQVCSVDLPGHGGTGLPEGELLSAMGLERFADILLDALNGAPWEEQGLIPPTHLAGHSLGGMLIQLLFQEGRATTPDRVETLARIEGVLLMAPTFPREVTWSTGELSLNPALVSTMVRSAKVRPGSGLTVYFPPDLFSDLFLDCGERTLPFTTLAPLASEESLRVWQELYGVVPEDGGTAGRPEVARGTFADKRLVTLSFADDCYMSEAEVADLHRHLKGLDESAPLPAAALHAADTDVDGEPMCLPHDAFYVHPEIATLDAAIGALLGE